MPLPSAGSFFRRKPGSSLRRRQHASYHFSAAQYAHWIGGVHPPVSWAVIPDRPTEDMADAMAVRNAQLQTTHAIHEVLTSLLDVPWSWAPVLQGRTVVDYLRHVIDLADVLYALADLYRQRRQSFRVGIGSICRRAQVPEIRRIVSAIAASLPGIPLHLFGAKLEVLRGWGNRPRTVISCDSAAWNGRFGAGIDKFEAERK